MQRKTVKVWSECTTETMPVTTIRQLLLALATFTLLLAACTSVAPQPEQTVARAPTPAPALSSGATNQTPIINYQERFLPTVARNGMVASPERLAAEIGTRIMREGGNAVDAAVATGFALAVTYPRAGNLAGGGFMLIHLADQNRQTLIDYRETAPAAAGRDLFLNDKGEVDQMREYFSHQSAGVPGTVAGMLYALEKYGTMSREQVLAPAIALAEQGMVVTFALNYEINARADQLRKNPEARRLFFAADGELYAIGDTWRQPDLAWTLRQIQNKGNAGFYSGDVPVVMMTGCPAESVISHRDDVDLKKKLAAWEKFYNYDRPHGAHKGKTSYEALREKPS